MTASGAARALPCGGDGTGVTGHHYGIERTDIDTEFERVGGDDGADIARTKALLNLAALTRQIAAAITAHGLGGNTALIACVF